MNIIYHHQIREVRTALTMLFLLLLVGGSVSLDKALALQINDTNDKGDLLAYTINNFDGELSLMLYDPHRDTHKTLLTGLDFPQFQASVDGRIAFSLLNEEGIAEIQVLDTQSEGRSPINLSQEIGINGSPLAWSPDGRYLAFASYQDDDRLIYVWDGDNAINITPDDMITGAESYRAVWSEDSRLAFTAWFGFRAALQNLRFICGIGTSPPTSVRIRPVKIETQTGMLMGS